MLSPGSKANLARGDDCSLEKRSLGEILLELELVSPEKLQELEQLRKSSSEKSLDKLLLDSNTLTELELIKAKGVCYQTPWVDLRDVEIDRALITLIPEKLARRYTLFPLENREDGLYIATADPRNILAFDEVQMLSGKVVIPRLALPSQILELIERFYQLEHQTTHQVIQQLQDEAVSSGVESVPEWTEQDQAPLIRLMDYIIRQALQNRASDIHIEPIRDGTQVRYRIDGVLFLSQKLPQKVHPPLLSRLKIISGLDISQHFVPQDGGLTYSYGSRLTDLRISMIPTIYGEKAVIRILNPDAQIRSLEEIGFMEEDLKQYQYLLQHNHGMILITGPTGSGKSTTLSSSIKSMVSPTINISSVEDPVEYKIDMVNQIQVNEKTGLTFARALRSLLRQDPDVLMIGEIRDEETANIAVRAALTGHLVLSSLHTNDAVSTVSRLSNMNLPPYLISSSLIGVVAQRLVRRICPECRKELEITAKEQESLHYIGIRIPQRSFQGQGCPKCNHTGYYGRIGIFELLVIDEHHRELIQHHADLKQYHLKKNLCEDAMQKVELGLTTVSELIRVVT